MHTDPISDLLTRIRNATKAHHQDTYIPYSTIKENILKVMKEKKFIEDYSVTGEKQDKTIEIKLKEDLLTPTLKRISKPGQRIYMKSKEIKHVKSGLGFYIMSTPKGVMTSIEAKKQNLGGELICEIS
ncbi:30S ribosomal protein S8 [Candidatus Peregrinibacteria bacterium]|nr:30S ribosomal protein S8 [Candidatus Peregrinibacteria bacterium]